jgi:hypothetical protein
MTLQAQHNCQRPLVATATVPRENGAHLEFGRDPSAQGCAQLIALGLALIADAHNWMAAQSPQFRAVPVEAMGFSCAAVSPWRTPAELSPVLRMYLWICAFDDYVEQAGLDQVDDMLWRCSDVVAGNGRDDSHWLLSALWNWQQDLASRPLYPALAGLWVEKFDSMLESMRHEWTAAQSAQRNPSGVDEYLAHADSVAAWVTVLPRWITYGGTAVLEHLDLLVAAMGDYVVANRLANDLASFSRERDQPATDNVLLYQVSPDWVKREIARRTDAAARRLARLVSARVLPAVELMRELEYATAFYSIAEFRGWGSDAR